MVPQAAVFPTSLNNFAAQFAADLNNDGKPDLVSNHQVALGNGDGTFTLLAGLGNQVSAIADFNGDGKLDALVTVQGSAASTQTGVMLGKGDGTFSSAIIVPGVGGLSLPLVADMNGDGRPDIVYSGSNTFVLSSSFTSTEYVGVLINTTPRPSPDFALTPASSTPVSSAPSCSLSSTSLQIANGSAQQVTVNAATTAPMTTSDAVPVLYPPGADLVWISLLLGSVGLWALIRKRPSCLIAPVLALLLTLLPSCGGSNSGGSHGGTPSGTYTATITATSGTLNHNISFMVVVR